MIIPTRNRFELTRDAISSVRAQTFVDWRLIVVDDASDDGSDEHLAKFLLDDHRASFVRRAVCEGSGAARQSGFELSDAPLVATLDSDDLWRPDKLARQVDLFERERPRVTGLGIVLCWHDYVWPERGRRNPVHRPRLDGRSSPLPSYNMSTLMVTRDVLASAGGFASALARHPRTAEHVDLFIRLTARAAVAVVPELLVDCRHHSGERNSDLQGTAEAAGEAAEVLAGLASELEGNPRQRAWLYAWVGARRLLVGDRRQGLAQLRTACTVAGPGTGAHIFRAYAPFVVKQLVAPSRR